MSKTPFNYPTQDLNLENFIDSPEMEPTVSEPLPPEETDDRYPHSTLDLVNKIGYLIGVPEEYFFEKDASMLKEHYDKLKQDKNARIIRNLCRLRNAFEKNYSKINKQIYYDMVGIYNMPELVPTDAITELEADGVKVVKANYQLNKYIIDINKLITERINNCKNLFPVWLNWSYVREIFIMPNGTSEGALKAAANHYFSHMSHFPHQAYMNWTLFDKGYILYNDKKFASLLYEMHGDQFTAISHVTNASQQTQTDIYEFLEASNRVELVVDCENSNPYKLYAVLNNLDESLLLDKIVKIVLYDDVHTSSAWKILNKFTKIQIEHIELKRILDQKSFLDVQLTAGVCRSYYKDNIDSFLLFSSDSDYWGLISELNEARYFVMVESEKVSNSTLRNLAEHDILYCFIDDFCTGNSYQIQLHALLEEVRGTLKDKIQINIQQVLHDAYWSTRVEMSDSEKQQIYDRYIKTMKLKIEENGDLVVQLGS